MASATNWILIVLLRKLDDFLRCGKLIIKFSLSIYVEVAIYRIKSRSEDESRLDSTIVVACWQLRGHILHFFLCKHNTTEGPSQMNACVRHDNITKYGYSVWFAVRKATWKAWNYTIHSLMRRRRYLRSVDRDSLADKMDEIYCVENAKSKNETSLVFGPFVAATLAHPLYALVIFFYCLVNAGEKFSPFRHNWPPKMGLRASWCARTMPVGRWAETANVKCNCVPVSECKVRKANAVECEWPILGLCTLDWNYALNCFYIWKTSHRRIENHQKKEKK